MSVCVRMPSEESSYLLTYRSILFCSGRVSKPPMGINCPQHTGSFIVNKQMRCLLGGVSPIILKDASPSQTIKDFFKLTDFSFSRGCIYLPPFYCFAHHNVFCLGESAYSIVNNCATTHSLLTHRSRKFFA